MRQGVGIPKRTRTGHGPVEIVETALDRAVFCGILAEVPFADHSGLVAGRLHQFGDGDDVRPLCSVFYGLRGSGKAELDGDYYDPERA